VAVKLIRKFVTRRFVGSACHFVSFSRQLHISHHRELCKVLAPLQNVKRKGANLVTHASSQNSMSGR